MLDAPRATRLCSLVLLATLTSATAAAAQDKITTPKEQFGFNLGDDYHLANYTQLVEYWRKLERESDRLVLFGMGAPDAEQVFLVRAVVLAMSPLGLAYILMNFELAQHRFAMVPGALLIAVAYIAGVALFHDTPRQVIAVLACVSTAFLVLMLICLPRDASR